jgi:hypothetical protein
MPRPIQQLPLANISRLLPHLRRNRPTHQPHRVPHRSPPFRRNRPALDPHRAPKRIPILQPRHLPLKRHRPPLTHRLSIRHAHRLLGRNGRYIRALDLIRRLGILRRLKQRSLMIIKILSRIDSLILYYFDDAIHSECQERAHDRSTPVDVMISRKLAGHYTRSETAGGIQTASSEEDAHHFGNKQAQADPDGRQKCGFVFLCCQHEDCEDEHGGQEHFEKHALGGGYALPQGGGYIERAGEDGGYDCGGADAREHLGDEAEGCAEGS